MRALLILNYDVDDVQKLMEYREAATPILEGTGGGTVLASTSGTVHLPEAPRGGDHTVVLQFPSVATARSVYESSAYQRLLSDRLRATIPRAAMIVPMLHA